MRDNRHTRTVLSLLLITALVVITVDYRGKDNSPLRPLRTFAAAIFGPIESVAASMVRPFSAALDTFTGAPSARRRIAELEAENQRLREQLRASRLDVGAATELDKLLELAAAGRYKVVAAHVVARRGAQGFEDTVAIDVGSRDGVARDMTVLNGDGLIGRVTHVGPTTSTVVLITDAASAVGARLEGSNEIGIARGLGRAAPPGQLIRLEMLDSTAALELGQRVVSFGSQGGRPYVPGVPVGTVAQLEQVPGQLTRAALIRPFARLTAIDVVGVVVAAPKRDPRDAVLPTTSTSSSQPPSRPGRARSSTRGG